MGSMGVNRRIAQVNQGNDENLNIRSKQGTYPTLEAATKKAEDVAKSDTSDAVVTKENGKYSVYGITEIGAQDPSANDVGSYEIHDFEASIVSFSATKRDQSGERLGGEVTKRVYGSSTDIEFSANKTNADGVTEFGRYTRNFMDYLNPLDSPGDSMSVYVKGEAGVSWGFGGAEVSGGVNLDMSRGDDGAIYVSLNANAGAKGTAGANLGSTGRLQGSLGGGVSGALTYRFRDAKEANDFLVHNMRKMPAVGDLFPELDTAPDMSKIGPVIKMAANVTAGIDGKVELGNLKVDGSVEFKLEGSETHYATGKVGHDWSRSARAELNVKAGSIGASLAAGIEEYTVNNNPIPENNGRYVAVDGQLQFTFTDSQLKAFSGGDKGAIMGGIMNVGMELALAGHDLDLFMKDMGDKIGKAVDSGDFGRTKTGEAKIGVGIQAQWEVQTDKEGNKTGASNELQYFRIGAVSSNSYSVGADAGVARFKVEAGVSRTDMQDFVLGKGDITYLQGLYFENRGMYTNAKATIGGPSAIVQGKSLAEWEQAWRQPGFDRN